MNENSFAFHFTHFWFSPFFLIFLFALPVSIWFIFVFLLLFCLLSPFFPHSFQFCFPSFFVASPTVSKFIHSFVCWMLQTRLQPRNFHIYVYVCILYSSIFRKISIKSVFFSHNNSHIEIHTHQISKPFTEIEQNEKPRTIYIMIIHKSIKRVYAFSFCVWACNVVVKNYSDYYCYFPFKWILFFFYCSSFAIYVSCSIFPA